LGFPGSVHKRQHSHCLREVNSIGNENESERYFEAMDLV
jgi:hypothetical protein